MKKFFVIALAASLALSVAACGQKDVNAVSNYGSTDNSIYLKDDLSVESVDFEEFDTAKYDVEEYRGFLDAEVEKYNNTHEYQIRYDKSGKPLDSITAAAAVVSCDAKDGFLITKMLYSSGEDLAAFEADSLAQRSGSFVEVGTLAGAPDEVLNAALVNAAGEAYDMAAVLEKDKGAQYRYIICDAASIIYGDGNVIAYSSNAVYTKNFGSIEVPRGQRVIVIFSENKK